MITLTAEYALRAVAWLAQHQGVARTVHEIADATTMPPEYLSKVLQELARSGLVISQRGPSGGYRLSQAPAEITVLAVVDAVSPLHRIHECPLFKQHTDGSLCALHQLLDDALAGVQQAFRKVTIADLLTNQRKRALWCASHARGAVERAELTTQLGANATADRASMKSRPLTGTSE